MVHCLEKIKELNDKAVAESRRPSRTMDIETRVAVSLAVQRYLRAGERFESSATEFNEACGALRKALPKGCHFVANVMHQNYIVTCDQEGNFDVAQIDTL